MRDPYESMAKIKSIFLWIVLLEIIVAGIIFFASHQKKHSQILSQIPSKPNVLVITIDTTRADHLPVYGYKSIRTPNLDSLAKHGILFKECATAAPLTLPSHCSIMTGLYPTYHGVRI